MVRQGADGRSGTCSSRGSRVAGPGGKDGDDIERGRAVYARPPPARGPRRPFEGPWLEVEGLASAGNLWHLIPGLRCPSLGPVLLASRGPMTLASDTRPPEVAAGTRPRGV